MKKTGLNILIGTILSVVLIVICLVTIKPNYTYMVVFDNKPFLSTDYSTFSYENEKNEYSKIDIKYDKTKENLTIESENNDKTIGNFAIKYNYETHYTVILAEGKTAAGTYELIDGNPSYNFEDEDGEKIAIFMKYTSLINVKDIDNDKINVTAQKIICSILSIIIGFILSFLAYPVILYDKCKENKNLALICIPMTIILCISSAFYIYFTLK